MKMPAIAATLCLACAAQAQETVLRKTLTLEGARKVIAAIEAEAAKRHVGGAIAVVDDGGNPICIERPDGTFAAGTTVSLGKARTAALFKHNTAFFEEAITKKGRTSMVALNDFTPLQGGVLIMADGQVLGAVGVSGASSAQEDEELATLGAAAISQTAQAPTAPAKPPMSHDVRAAAAKAGARPSPPPTAPAQPSHISVPMRRS
jgi:glc operon protein GlcG